MDWFLRIASMFTNMPEFKPGDVVYVVHANGMSLPHIEKCKVAYLANGFPYVGKPKGFVQPVKSPEMISHSLQAAFERYQILLNDYVGYCAKRLKVAEEYYNKCVSMREARFMVLSADSPYKVRRVPKERKPK